MDLLLTGSAFTLLPCIVFSGEDIGDDFVADLLGADRVFVLFTGETVVEVLPSTVISRWSLFLVAFEEATSKSASLSSESTRVERRCRLAGR